MDIDCQINDISLPDESMRSQSDNWSMKSYPIHQNYDNKSLTNSSG